METTTSFSGTLQPDRCTAASAIRTSPVQQGTSMWTTVTLRTSDTAQSNRLPPRTQELNGRARTSAGERRQASLPLGAAKMLAHHLLAERVRLTLDDMDRVLRALAQAGPQPITIALGHEAGLAAS